MEPMRLTLADIVEDFYTNAGGARLFAVLKGHLDAGTDISLSLTGVDVLSSSFLNSSFGELISLYGLEGFKRRVKLMDVPKPTAKIIRSYIDSESMHSL